MSLIELVVNKISYNNTQSGAFALILDEVDGARKLPIVIGGFEAQSIAVELDKELRPPRPLTHDLFKTTIERFGIFIKQVIIHKLVDGVFYSSIICERDQIEEIIDARTSDAISLAMRFEAPIYTYEAVLDKAGIVLPKNDPSVAENLIKEPQKTEKNYSNLSVKQLEKAIEKAVASEDYELAARLRDEIAKKTNT